AGKKSAQIREILISESAWEEMTCLFAPSLTPMFLSIASGFSIFGLLANEKFQLLGVTSFSVYLNHGVFQFISKHYLYDYGMYLWQGASVLLIAVTAPVLYKYVELAFQAKKASSLSIMVKP
ncbi:hypothetical protein ACSTCJ_26975, partial [Klebsiella pneumoniae]